MTVHFAETFPAFVRAFLATDQRGLGYRAAQCYVHLHDLLNFPTGPLRHDGLRSRIDTAKNAAEAACSIHDARAHDALLFAWRLALEQLYTVPHDQLDAEDRDARAAFEALAVNFNSRVWLDT